MEKPILLIREDFTNNMLNLIAESKLPLVIIEPILDRLLNETRIGLQKQYEKEKAEYEKSLKDNKDDTENIAK